MHSLLARQFKQLGLTSDEPPDPESWKELIDRLDRTYREADQSRQLLERSLALTSVETRDLYDELRKASEGQLAVERDKLEAVIRALGDGLCVIDGTGRAVLLNAEAERLLGAGLEAVQGRPFTSLFRAAGPTTADQPVHVGPAGQRTDDGWLDRPDGTRLPVAFVLSPLTAGASSGAVLLFRDITERKAAQEARLATADLLRRQQAAVQQLTTSTTPHTADFRSAVAEITALGSETMEVDRLGVWLFDPSGTAIECADLYVRPTRAHETGARIEGTTCPRYFAEIQAGRTIIANDARTDPRTSEFASSYLEPLGITAMLDVPIFGGGQLIGVVCHEHVGPGRTWRSEEALFATTLADFVALAWEADRRRRLSEELEAARDAAEASSRAKSAFLARMSHEIRTPMNGVLGMTELLAATSLTDRQARFVDVVQRSGQQLLRIINDILDFSKIEAGKLDVVSQRFDLPELITGIVDLLQEAAGEKHLTLSCRIEPTVPRWFVGDPGRLGQVVTNLLGNAIKFTPHGTVGVTVGLDRERSGHFRVSVSDTGIGIPESYRGQVFTPFSQAYDQPNRPFGGTGLGLSIASQLAQLMGGTLDFESREGRGSVFTVSLPFAPDTTATALDSSAMRDPAAAAPGPSGRVLVAEDNPINQELVVELLRSFGLECTVVENGRQAVATALAGDYALILMDCDMPVLDGLAASVELRRAGLTTPIVALTAHAIEGYAERCLGAGMTDYLTKPFTRRQLSDLIERWLPPPGGEPHHPRAAVDRKHQPSPR